MKKSITLLLLAACCLTGHAQSVETQSNHATGYIHRNSTMYYTFTIDGVLYMGYQYSDGDVIGTLVRYPAWKSDASFTVPDGITRIARGAFQGCQRLKTLTLPAGLIYIGENAFDDSSIEEFRTSSAYTGVKAAPTDDADADEVARYNLSGQRLQTPQPGVNIVETNDGKARKELVK